VLGLLIFTGIASALFRGVFDAFMIRTVDFLLAMPSLVFALVLIAFLNPVYNVILVLAITGWPGVARIARVHSLQNLSIGYVEAARGLLKNKELEIWRSFHNRYLRARFRHQERLRHLYRTAARFTGRGSMLGVLEEDT